MSFFLNLVIKSVFLNLGYFSIARLASLVLSLYISAYLFSIKEKSPSTLFLAIIKYVEDSVNARYDKVNGNVQVLIMVEDSIRFYSMFLPIIYTEIVQQTRRSLSEDLNQIQRLIRRRARPKILLA